MWPLLRVLLLCSTFLYGSKITGGNGSDSEEPDTKRIKLTMTDDPVANNSRLVIFESHLKEVLEEGVEHGDTWYIVSNRWMSEWKDWSREESAQDSTKTFKPMNNADIIDWDSYNLLPDYLAPIKSMLKENVDYFFVPESTWKLLQEWYGTTGPIIKRTMVWYPHQVLRCFADLDEIEFVYEDQDIHKIIQVFHGETVKQLKGLIRKCIHSSKPEIPFPETLYFSVRVQGSGREFVLDLDADYYTVSELALESVDRVIYVYNVPSKDIPAIGNLSEKISLSDDGGLVGLSNLGNTSYMNSALQSLIHCQAFRDILLSVECAMKLNAASPDITPLVLFRELQQLIKHVCSTRCVSVADTSVLKFWFDFYDQSFVDLEQHDSAKFIDTLFNRLHDYWDRGSTVKPVVEESPNSYKHIFDIPDTPIADNFRLTIKSYLDCPTCDMTSRRYDSTIFLSLPIPTEDTLTLTVLVQNDKQYGEVGFYFGAESRKTIGCLKKGVLERLGLSHEDYEVKLIESGEDSLWNILESSDDESLTQYTCKYLHASICARGVGNTWMLFSVDGLDVGFPLLVTIKEDQIIPSLLEFSQNPGLQRQHFSVIKISSHSVKIDIGRSIYMQYTDRVQGAYYKECLMKAFQEMLLSKHEIIEKISPPTEFKEQEVSLDKCLEMYMNGETLEPEEIRHCLHCNQKLGITRNLRAANLPNVLMVQLKRFNESGEKVNTPIKFSMRYDSAHLLFYSSFSDWDINLKGETIWYELFAITLHHGKDLSSGHCTESLDVHLITFIDTAMTKNPDNGQWYSFRDETVLPSQVAWLEKIMSSAYILLYKKKTLDSK